MIILKHYKVDDISYVSQKDILRVLQRGLKRAKIDVKYSQGYIPHMLTYTSTPVPLGIQSLAEYFAVECSGIDKDEFLARYNASMPTGMRAVDSYFKEKNPNIAAIVTASDYRVKSNKPLSKEIESIADAQSYVIDVNKKGEAQQKDIAPMLYGIKTDGDILCMRLASGNTNLRCDDVVRHINAKFGCDIKINDIFRTAQLVGDKESFRDVEEVLR